MSSHIESQPPRDTTSIELDMIRHVDDTEQRLMSRMDERMDTLSSQFHLMTSEIRETHAQDLRFVNERIIAVETNLTNKLDEQAKEINKHFETLGENMTESFGKLDNRITALERWQWLIVGGSVVVMFFLTNYVIKHINIAFK